MPNPDIRAIATSSIFGIYDPTDPNYFTKPNAQQVIDRTRQALARMQVPGHLIQSMLVEAREEVPHLAQAAEQLTPEQFNA